MIPPSIEAYLKRKGIAFEPRPHRPALCAQRLAAALPNEHHAVTKTVLLEAYDRPWMALVRSSDDVDLERFAQLIGAPKARVMAEKEFSDFFPECEVGAEPPLGELYGIPVVLERSLLGEPRIVVSAGTHQDALELSTGDFMEYERPTVGAFAVPPDVRRFEERHVPV